MPFSKLLLHQKEWVQKKLMKDSSYFHKLSKGQNPMGLFIACSDSRITIEDMIGAKPGDIFSLRNISNVVSSDDLSGMSVIEYAMTQLEIPNIVICGHYGCGGIQAAMSDNNYGLLDPWLRKIKEVYTLHKEELDSILEVHERFDRLVELNVYEQCRNIMKVMSVQKALISGKTQIRGWVFDMKSGFIKDMEFDVERMLQEIIQ